MSWDVLLQRFPAAAKTAADIPDDYMPPVIGSRSQVVSSLLKIIPTADASDPSWVSIDGDGFSIEVNIGDDGHCTDIMLHVRGSDAAIQAVRQIAERLQVRALDCSTGEFLDAMSDPAAGFRQWRAYRDQIVGRSDDATEPKDGQR